MRISRQIEFDAGHRVPNHASKCKNPHGHRYVVEATIDGDLNQTAGDSQEGMVLDFGFLKRLLMEHVHDVLDHGSICYEGDLRYAISLGEAYEEDGSWVNRAAGEENRYGWKVIVVNFVPTAENLAIWVAQQIGPHIPVLTGERAVLDTVSVWE